MNCELAGSPEEPVWLFTAWIRCTFLWNIFISLRRSWCFSSWRSKSSRSLYLHSYFMLNSNIFLQKQHNKLTLTSVMRIWCVDTIIAGGRIGGIKGMSPGSATLSLPRLPLGSLCSPIFSAHAVFSLLFPPMRSLVPGYFERILEFCIVLFRLQFSLSHTSAARC